MNNKQFERIQTGKGFIAALDQSGGSTPKALAAYGISENYSNDEDVHISTRDEKRIIKSAFDSPYVLGAILFESTMDRFVDGGKYS
jgi:fructose-bisphosphate aldolase class I